LYSCCVLYLKEEAPVSQYIVLASAFNVLHKWRFSYGRKCGKNRIVKLEVPWPLPEIKQSWAEEVTEIEDALKVFTGDIEKNVQSQLPEFAREPVDYTPEPVLSEYQVAKALFRLRGKPGVVWHTQGSGKSFSMLFFAARVVRHPAMQNPTLVVLTDRNDLDDQLFAQFQRCADILGQTDAVAGQRARAFAGAAEPGQRRRGFHYHPQVHAR
jgi:hypothetical protein